MRGFLQKLNLVTTEYHILRGVLSFGIVYPSGAFIQQVIAGKTWETYNFKKIMRMALYGACYVGPTMYMWERFSSPMWPVGNFPLAMRRAVIQQLSFSHFTSLSFFLIMPLLEGKSFNRAMELAYDKTPHAWKVAACYWPIVQTINFRFITQKNRVIFSACCSLFWGSLLAYWTRCEALAHAYEKPNKSIKSK